MIGSRPRGPLLAFDGGSSLLSAAVGTPASTASRHATTADRSSSTLLRLVDRCLRDAGLTPADLAGLVVLRGPGSFTGLRVALALAQGLHQSLDLAVATLSTFEALAAQVEAEAAALSVVRAGRDDWHVQLFSPGPRREPAEKPSRLTTERLVESRFEVAGQPPIAVGFDLDGIEIGGSSQPAQAAEPLAPNALELADTAIWDASTLSEPLYLSPPPADERAGGGPPEAS